MCMCSYQLLKLARFVCVLKLYSWLKTMCIGFFCLYSWYAVILHLQVIGVMCWLSRNGWRALMRVGLAITCGEKCMNWMLLNAGGDPSLSPKKKTSPQTPSTCDSGMKNENLRKSGNINLAESYCNTLLQIIHDCIGRETKKRGRGKVTIKLPLLLTV